MKHLKRYAAFCMALVVACSAMAVPASATDYQSTYNFWNWAYDNSWFLGKAIIGFSAGNVCQVSEDSLHHATTHTSGFAGGGSDGERVYSCVCDLCGESFTAVATDLEHTYDILLAPSVKGVDSDGLYYRIGDWVPSVSETYVDKANIEYLESSIASVNCDAVVSAFWNETGANVYVRWTNIFTPSIDMTITLKKITYYGQSLDACATNEGLYLSYIDSSGTQQFVHKPSSDLTEMYYTYNLAAGVEYTFWFNQKLKYSTVGTKSYHPVLLPEYSLKSTYSFNEYNRPSSFSPSFSYTDESGNVQVSVQDIFDELDLTYYNPVTNTTTNITNWTYDYSDRSYTVLTDSNNTTTITYGDEYITINEGDNITYNIYYYSAPDSSGDGDSSGSDGSGDDDGGGLLDKIGELIGSVLGGFIDVIGAALGKVIDSLIDLVTLTIDKLVNVINLFGSFGDALGVLWSWLPEEVVTVLVSGVTVIVFASVIKLFMR